ncbi:MAG: AAA family ATPase [Burkholderiaceae bacterium]
MASAQAPALQRRDITIESIGEQVGAISTSRLEPEPIPLDVKVILFGERYLYYLLGEHDPDFRQLFRVVADFDDDLPRDAHHQDGMARIIAEQAQSNALMPIDRGGLARLIDQSARLADDATRLSANVQVLMEIATEGERLARQAGRNAIGTDDIRTAVRARRERFQPRRRPLSARDLARHLAHRHRRRQDRTGQRPGRLPARRRRPSATPVASPPPPASARAAWSTSSARPTWAARSIPRAC